MVRPNSTNALLDGMSLEADPALSGDGALIGGLGGVYPFPPPDLTAEALIPAVSDSIPDTGRNPGGPAASNAMETPSVTLVSPAEAATAPAVVAVAMGDSMTAGGDAAAVLPGVTSSAVASVGTSAASTSNFHITASYDATITGLQASNLTLYNQVTGAITSAIQFYEAAFTNTLTITIGFSYASLASSTLAQTSGNFFSTNYTRLSAALTAHDGAAINLPASYPVSNATWNISQAEMRVLGLGFATGSVATVTLNKGQALNFDPNNRGAAGGFDAIGALEHEISEALGRIDALGSTTVLGAGIYTPLDLFRYTAQGVLATAPGAGYLSNDGGATDLAAFNAATNNGDFGDWASSVVNDSYDAVTSASTVNTVSAVDLTEMSLLGYTLATACYAAGTRILTDKGEVAVENLAAGDRVWTRFSGLTPVAWIGHRRIDCARHPDPVQVLPIRVEAGAFGANALGEALPRRALLLSPDHAVAVKKGTEEEGLIPIRLLVNGGSIRREDGTRRVHYFHVELARHDLLLAEGMEAESYLDTGNRGMFGNGGASVIPHPHTKAPFTKAPSAEAPSAEAPSAEAPSAEAQERREGGSCLPFWTEAEDVRPVWEALAARSEESGHRMPVPETTADPALCLILEGRLIRPVARQDGRYVFVLPAAAARASLCSRHAQGSVREPWLEDRRRLGVRVTRLTLRHAGQVTDIALDDPRLREGWWGIERDDGPSRRPAQGGWTPRRWTPRRWTPRRWTNGMAMLPVLAGPAVLEIEIEEGRVWPVSGEAGENIARAA